MREFKRCEKYYRERFFFAFLLYVLLHYMEHGGYGLLLIGGL